MIRVSEDGRTALPLEVPDAEALIDLGVSLDQRSAAAVEPDRRALWILPLDRGITEQRIEGTQIGGASFDVDGRAWFTDAGRILRLVPNGLPRGGRGPARSGGADHLGPSRPRRDARGPGRRRGAVPRA